MERASAASAQVGGASMSCISSSRERTSSCGLDTYCYYEAIGHLGRPLFERKRIYDQIYYQYIEETEGRRSLCACLPCMAREHAGAQALLLLSVSSISIWCHDLEGRRLRVLIVELYEGRLCSRFCHRRPPRRQLKNALFTFAECGIYRSGMNVGS